MPYCEVLNVVFVKIVGNISVVQTWAKLQCFEGCTEMDTVSSNVLGAA